MIWKTFLSAAYSPSYLLSSIIKRSASRPLCADDDRWSTSSSEQVRALGTLREDERTRVRASRVKVELMLNFDSLQPGGALIPGARAPNH